MIKVGVFGAAGRMGAEVCRAVLGEADMELVAAVDPGASSTLRDVGVASDVPIAPEANAMVAAEVAVDFTEATAAAENIRWCLENDIHCVVGTTGLNEAQVEGITQRAEDSKGNVLIAPNFAIGAVLMMEFAKRAARFLGDAEIIEMHHPGKLDAPSGTALATAKGIDANRRDTPTSVDADGSPQGARGGQEGQVHIHSVRLPGLVAHQEVIFGGKGQTLSIRHDSTDRTSFMPGVLLAIRNISKHRGVTVGLHELMDADLI